MTPFVDRIPETNNQAPANTACGNPEPGSQGTRESMHPIPVPRRIWWSLHVGLEPNTAAS
ncbi:hypothetical protein E4U43_007905 [Claviceps pusilla]|uniref:Uncharacterized protein n=1 Tax=Claviceps pusilla TaxID=123648 RepID=A0A9P7NBT5_9HYPO|nr:hypothetical protein E4U43_007905 [Claviceps pusilla]